MSGIYERPIALDLCCGGGGMTKGLERAGFRVIGVDKDHQPEYCGSEFVQADALNLPSALLDSASVIHASPHCQWATAYRRKGHGVGEGYVNQIPEFREMLRSTGKPYMIENVESAGDHLISPIRLCGSMFGLDVQRHRLFESSIPLHAPGPCDHSIWSPRFPPAANRKNLRRTVEVGVWRIPLGVQRKAMGIDWMSLPVLSLAIPPAYAEFLGKQLMGAIS